LRSIRIAAEQDFEHRDTLRVLSLELVGDQIQVLGGQVVVLALRVQLGIGPPLEEVFVRILEFEVFSKELPLVGTADFRADNASLFIGQLRNFSVGQAALLEKLGPFLDPIVPVGDEVPGCRDVVGQIPTLKLPKPSRSGAAT